MLISKEKTPKSLQIAMILLLGSCFVFVSDLAQADQGGESGPFYLGAAYGYSRVDNEDFKDNNTVLMAFAGVKVFNILALEFGINDFGRTNNNGSYSDLNGNSLAFVGFIPLSDQLNIFAKVGNLWWENKISVLNTFNDTLSGSESYYGVGTNISLSDSIALRFELDRYDVKLDQNEVSVPLDRTFNLDVASIGISLSL